MGDLRRACLSWVAKFRARMEDLLRQLRQQVTLILTYSHLPCLCYSTVDYCTLVLVCCMPAPRTHVGNAAPRAANVHSTAPAPAHWPPPPTPACLPAARSTGAYEPCPTDSDMGRTTIGSNALGPGRHSQSPTSLRCATGVGSVKKDTWYCLSHQHHTVATTTLHPLGQCTCTQSALLRVATFQQQQTAHVWRRCKVVLWLDVDTPGAALRHLGRTVKPSSQRHTAYVCRHTGSLGR